MKPQIDLERVNQLITEEIAGMISEEDLAYLKMAIAVSPEAWEHYHTKRAMLLADGVQEGVRKGHNPARRDAILLGEVPRSRKLHGMVLTVGSIAALFILAIGIYRFIPTRKLPVTIAQAPIPLAAYNGNNIQLQLPGGKIIDLSNTQGQVQSGTVSLHNSSKTLTYSSPAAQTLQWAALTVPPGKDFKVTLDDGSEVWLNATTTIQFPLHFAADQREIVIHGEAYIKVAKQAGKPFKVRLPGSTVQVLGTEFNVNSYDSSKVKVALINGSIRLHTATDSLVVQPGNEVLVAANRLQQHPFDKDYILGWRQGIYAFNNSPLSEVVEVLPRWFGVHIQIDNPALKNRHFTGMIDRNQPIRQSLDAFNATNKLDYTIEGNTVHIR
jgi:hypothetical protein